MSGEAATQLTEYLGLLSALAQAGEDVLIVGGHAVNLWAELYLADEPELSYFLPFTSRDLDLHRPGRATAAVLCQCGARAVRQTDPFGKVFDLVEAAFSLQARDGRTLNVEALKALPGLTAGEIKQAAVRIEYRRLPLSVLHPIALLKAKAHNLAHLNQSGRQDAKHFRILLLCIRAFLREWLRRAKDDGSARRLFELLELTLKTLAHHEVLQAAHALRADLRAAVPLHDLRQSRSPQIAKFLAERFPRWEKSVSGKLPA